MSNARFLLCVVHGAAIKVCRAQEEDCTQQQQQQQRHGIDVTECFLFQI